MHTLKNDLRKTCPNAAVTTTNPTRSILGLNREHKPTLLHKNYTVSIYKLHASFCEPVFIQWTTVVSLFMQVYDLILSH